jgi:cobyrinic acid a,c-diamide synthase
MLSSNLPPIRVAVARDECFCFSDDNLRSLEKTEAVLIYFSPIDDLILPSDINMLYIGNGHLGIRE